jgi:hypothetical protein
MKLTYLGVNEWLAISLALKGVTAVTGKRLNQYQ